METRGMSWETRHPEARPSLPTKEISFSEGRGDLASRLIMAKKMEALYYFGFRVRGIW